MSFDFSTYRQQFIYPHSPLNRWHKFPESVIPLWVADMDDAADEGLLARLHSRLTRGHLGYVSPPASLYEALMAFCLRHYGWAIKRDWIVFMPGVVMGLAAAVQSRTREGDGVMVPQPVYAPFFEVVSGAKRVIHPWIFDIEHERLMYGQAPLHHSPSSEVKLLMWCHPHNPGGTVFSSEELTRVAQWALRHRLPIVCDEIHADMNLREGARHQPFAALPLDGWRDNTITLMSLNKTFNIPSLGLAYAIIPNPDYRRVFEAVLAPWKMFTPMALEAAHYCLTEGDPWIASMQKKLQARVAQVVQWGANHRDRVRVIVPQASYLVWIQLLCPCPQPFSPSDWVGYFAQHGVGLNGGALYRAGDDWVRINVGTTEEVLATALSRMSQAINQLPSAGS